MRGCFEGVLVHLSSPAPVPKEDILPAFGPLCGLAGELPALVGCFSGNGEAGYYVVNNTDVYKRQILRGADRHVGHLRAVQRGGQHHFHLEAFGNGIFHFGFHPRAHGNHSGLALQERHLGLDVIHAHGAVYICLLYTSSQDMIFIPKKAKNVEVAKDFLKFMARDDMLKLYTV